MYKLTMLWRVAQFPLFTFLVLITLYLVWTLLDLPPREEMIEIIKEYFARYGYIAVFIGSFFEALLLIGWYFPGGLVIFLSVILSPSPMIAAVSVVIVTFGLYAGYTTNFFLGKYGWYRLLLKFGIRKQLDEAQIKLSRYGVRAIFMSYWNPGLASFISTAAGVLRYEQSRFFAYSFIAVTIWDIFWGTVVYSLGERALSTLMTWPFILFTIVVWIIARYVETRLSSKNIQTKTRSGYK